MPASEPISSTLPPVLCRLLIGHDAERLEKPNKEGRTHRWKVFVRSPNGYPDFNDRSFIKKVVFQLHTTFDKPKRTIRSPPFELEETAYGCFNLPITIHFKNLEKTFLINYDITLPIQKKAQVQQDQFLEVTNPPSKEFVNLVLKYGGKLKSVGLEKPETTTPKPIVRLNESEEKHKKLEEEPTEKEKHSKKHKKRDKSKEHKRKRENSGERRKERSEPKSKVKSPDISTEAPSLATQDAAKVNDLFGDLLPSKRPKTAEEDRVSTAGLVKVSNSKRPKFFVSSNLDDEKVKEEQPEPPSTKPSSNSSTTQPKVEQPALFDFVSQMTEKFEQQVTEMAQAPMPPISPIGKLPLIKEEISNSEVCQPSPSNVEQPKVEQPNTNGIIKDEAYLKNVNRIRSLLFQPIKRKTYNLSFLHNLDNVSDELIGEYERPVPLAKFDPAFTEIIFNKEYNKKLFEKPTEDDEPQLFRLIQQESTQSSTSSSPQETNHNDELLADLFD